MKRAIVITGIGVVAPKAMGSGAFLYALQNGVSCIDEIRSFDTRTFRVHRGGEVTGLAEVELERECPAHMGRATRMALVAADEAIRDAKLENGGLLPERAAVIMGTTSGEAQTLESMDEAWALGKEADTPERCRDFSSNIIAATLATVFGFRGPAFMVANACSSGNYAVGAGLDLIRRGEADVAIAGGVDVFSKIALTGFAKMHAMAPQNCQPFDKNRQGLILSEGAGVVVLEERARAEARGAKIYAEVLGWGFGCDAYHTTALHAEGMAAVMAHALEDAGLDAGAIDYLSAHGTGTVANDSAETHAVKRAFGDHAYRVPVSSIKSMIGHAMGAAGALETAACCLALKYEFLPPTIHYTEPDPECDLDYVPNQARFRRVNAMMNNAFAFGGNHASLILGRC